MEGKYLELNDGTVNYQVPYLKVVPMHFPDPGKLIHIQGAQDIYEVMKKQYEKEDGSWLFREVFYAMMIDTRGKLLGIMKISEGGKHGCVFEIGFLIAAISSTMARGVVLVHNHPSGNPEPSRTDNEMTKNTKNVMKMIGCDLMDHVICTPYGYYSYSNEGKL